MKAICSLPWINETAKRAFCFLEFLNTNVDFVSEDYSKNVLYSCILWIFFVVFCF